MCITIRIRTIYCKIVGYPPHTLFCVCHVESFLTLINWNRRCITCSMIKFADQSWFAKLSTDIFNFVLKDSPQLFVLNPLYFLNLGLRLSKFEVNFNFMPFISARINFFYWAQLISHQKIFDVFPLRRKIVYFSFLYYFSNF
jgi:hypothetical protein